MLVGLNLLRQKEASSSNRDASPTSVVSRSLLKKETTSSDVKTVTKSAHFAEDHDTIEIKEIRDLSKSRT
jgi:hypothetical protein